MDWKELFIPTSSILEIIFRGSVMYLVLFTMLRFVLKREAGRLGLADVLLIVIVADAAQNGMAGKYKSLTEGIVLVGTLVFWNFAFDWLAYRNATFAKFVHPPALLLVKDGRMLRRNMRSELITETELRGLLREDGVDDLADVKAARMESDGGISVIKRSNGSSADEQSGKQRKKAL